MYHFFLLVNLCFFDYVKILLTTLLLAWLKKKYKSLGPDYQNACKVTMFSTLYLELQHESHNVPAML